LEELQYVERGASKKLVVGFISLPFPLFFQGTDAQTGTAGVVVG